MSRLFRIQQALRVGKGEYNDFGKYSYRTAEGILASLKKALNDDETIVLSDEIVDVAGAIFVTSTATLSLGGEVFTAKASALHPLSKKGMDPSQITGAASSYARKYALGGLLALDDSRDDPDTSTQSYEPTTPEDVLNEAKGAQSVQDLATIWTQNKQYQGNSDFQKAKDARKTELTEAA